MYFYNILLLFSGDGSDVFEQGMGHGDMYVNGQPLDQEPPMGQVPIIPPGTPPNDSWMAYNGMSAGAPYGRRSPSLPMSQNHGMPSDTLAPMVAPSVDRVMMHGHPDNERYGDYQSPPSNHVEVY